LSQPAPRDHLALRAQWLRLKNSVVDANTELPTLSAVMDDVRKLASGEPGIGLLFLDVGGGGEIERIHGWHVYDAVLRAFAEMLEALRDEGTLKGSDIISVLSVRSDKFLVFLGARGSTPMDDASIKPLAAQMRRRISDVLPRALKGLPAGACAFAIGHAVVQPHPTQRVERSVLRALDEAMLVSLRQRSEEAERRAESLDAVIEAQKIVTLYQPIVDLRSRRILGHEAFSRGPAGSPFEDASSLFSLAERTGRLVNVECLCRNRAILHAGRHLNGKKLFLNTSAKVLSHPAVSGDDFLREVEGGGLRHDDVVLEVTERINLDAREAHETLRGLKRQGFGIAIDDMGAGYSSLQSVAEIEPDYLKFDISLVRNIDRNRIKRTLLETLVELSETIGAGVIAEGIEMESELETLRELGVHLGQGHFLAPPQGVR